MARTRGVALCIWKRVEIGPVLTEVAAGLLMPNLHRFSERTAEVEIIHWNKHHPYRILSNKKNEER